VLSGVEERVVDERGRLYLSRSLRGKKFYLGRVGRILVLAQSPEELEEATRALRESRRRVIDEYLRLLEELGEPSVEELEEATREAMWRAAQRAT